MDSDEKLIEEIKRLLNDSDPDDPYEKGFADKLYEDEFSDSVPEEPTAPQPSIRAYNADYYRAPQRTPQRRQEQERTQHIRVERPAEPVRQGHVPQESEEALPKKKHSFWAF